MSQQNPLLRGSSFRKGQSRERRAVKSDEMGRGLEGKQKSKALSEAINSKKKNKNHISGSPLIFEKQKPKTKKQNQTTIKYKVSRYGGNVQESRDGLGTGALLPRQRLYTKE